jgi:hypothetical protein
MSFLFHGFDFCFTFFLFDVLIDRNFTDCYRFWSVIRHVNYDMDAHNNGFKQLADVWAELHSATAHK